MISLLCPWSRSICLLFESGSDVATIRPSTNPKNNPILIHGDCDADGVSACAVLNKYLTNIGYNIHYYIPNRSSEGHSMSLKAIDFAKSIGSNLIITCDLGMSCFDEIEFANKAILQEKTEVSYPGMSWEDTLGNLKCLDEWRKNIGYSLPQDS